MEQSRWSEKTEKLKRYEDLDMDLHYGSNSSDFCWVLNRCDNCFWKSIVKVSSFSRSLYRIICCKQRTTHENIHVLLQNTKNARLYFIVQNYIYIFVVTTTYWEWACKLSNLTACPKQLTVTLFNKSHPTFSLFLLKKFPKIVFQNASENVVNILKFALYNQGLDSLPDMTPDY